VIGALVELDPAAEYVDQSCDAFQAYVLADGDYDLHASRDDRFGSLPPMQLAVSDSVTGLELVLPPQASEDAVSDGGFEEGTLSAWQVGGGTRPPELISPGHTGEQAVLMGSTGHSWVLGQTLTVPSTLTNATLSFLVRLEDPDGPDSEIDVELVGTPISHTWVVSTGVWSHVWFPVEDAVGQTVTLQFAVSDNVAVHLDEVSLGSALSGGGCTYMPIISR
jgi:hypothetical protein